MLLKYKCSNMVNVITMAKKTFSCSRSKILQSCFAYVSEIGYHECSYFLLKSGNRRRFIFIDIFCVAPQKTVQLAGFWRVWSPDVESAPENELSSNFLDNNLKALCFDPIGLMLLYFQFVRI